MPAITWTDDLAVGVELIDDQHKELIDRVNRLTDAMFDGKGADEVGRLLAFLADYVVSHFGAEERLMFKYQYPGYEGHKEAHDRFVSEFIKVKTRHDSGDITSSLALTVFDGMWTWLRNHIRGADKELGDFVRRA